MKTLIVSLIALVSFNSFASTTVCYFTEPFITVKVESGSTYLNDGDKVIINNMTDLDETKISTSAIMDNLIIANFESNKTKIDGLMIDLSKKGNDGMSDEEYQAEGLLIVNGQTIYGGCNLK